MEVEASFFWLPEEVIHHIWSYLKPGEQVQTIPVSKNWLNAWRTNPRLSFDDGFFNQDEESFQLYVDTTLSRFKAASIREFNLSMAMAPDGFSTSVNRWLDFASRKAVQILQIALPDLSVRFSYNLPSGILGIESLTTLCVARCNFPDPETLILCKNLMVLHLVSVYNLSNETLSRLISACPRINELRISDHYDELDNIKIFDLGSLRELWIEEGYASETRTIEVTNAPKLETAAVKLQYGQCGLTLHACPNLRSLSLKNADLRDEFFETLKDEFPGLEILELAGCYGFREESLPSRSQSKVKLRVSESCWDDDQYR